MSRILSPHILPFAAFLAGRLGLDQIAVVGDHPPPLADAGGVTISADDPTRVEEVNLDCLPIVVAPWEIDRSLSVSGRALLTLDNQLSLVVTPPLDDPAIDGAVDLRRWLGVFGLYAPLVGTLPLEGGMPAGALALVESRDRPLSPVVRAPDDFKVIAFMPTYNEIDIIAKSIDDLQQQGVETYVLDNWSTDGTHELAASLLGHGVVGIERTPADGAPEFYDLKSILGRIEELTSEVQADWFIKHDADEIRRGPWDGVSLRDAIYRADVAGYNRIDFTVANFPPTDNSFAPGSDFVEHFRRFDWGHNPGHFAQQKAWKNLGQEVSLARQAAHIVEFENARVFPYKFLLLHYPIRSQAHGERKIFQDRMPRVLPAARLRGWHNHYDRHTIGDSFIVDPADVRLCDDDFFSRYFVERLSGVGIERVARAKPPAS